MAALRTLLVGVAVVIATAGCITGERPTLLLPSEVDDASVRTVLDRLDRADTATFTAEYDIIPSATGATTSARVVQTDGVRIITIGDVQYRTEGGVTTTCRGDDCVGHADDARISDLNITHRFWGSSFRSRLELDAARDVAPTVGNVTTIADQPAACVDVTVVGGTVVYCALDAGPLARYFGADVSIELTSFSFDALL